MDRPRLVRGPARSRRWGRADDGQALLALLMLVVALVAVTLLMLVPLGDAVGSRTRSRTAADSAALAAAAAYRDETERRYGEITRAAAADPVAAAGLIRSFLAENTQSFAATDAERAFELVIDKYGDEKPFARQPKVTIAERAKVELFELRNLRVGKEAPDSKGEDLDGKEFKLSDYRGKVVLLDFWGDW